LYLIIRAVLIAVVVVGDLSDLIISAISVRVVAYYDQNLTTD